MESTGELWITRLLQLFSHQGPAIYAGDKTLCLSAPILAYISGKIQAVSEDATQSTVIDIARRLEQVMALKIVEDNAIVLTSPLNLSHFRTLNTLELKRVPLQYVKGLQHLREQLKVLIVQRCLNDMEELLVSCAGDKSSPKQWTVLAELNLSRNSISSAETALELLPALKILDLRHNCLCGDTGGLKVFRIVLTMEVHTLCLIHLSCIEQLHLGYNRLTTVPRQLSRTLTTLNMRGNSLDDLDGIQGLTALRSLQVQDNCLSRFQSMQPLLSLHCIAELGLEGNPIAFHPRYRLLVVHNLSTLLAPLQFRLDGSPLSASERKLLSKRARVLTSVMRPAPRLVVEQCSEEECVTSEMEIHERGATSEAAAPRRIPRRRRKARHIDISDESDAEIDGVSKSFEDSLLQDRPEVSKLQDLRKKLDKNWLKGSPKERLHQLAVTKDHSHRCQQTSSTSQSLPVTSVLQTDPESRDESPVRTSTPADMQGKPSEDEGDFSPGETFLVEMYESDFDDADDVVIATDRKLMIGITERFLEERDVSTATVVDRLDLQCLIGVKTDRLYVKLLFDHDRRDRRRREYTMLNSSDLGKLKDILHATVAENQKNMVIATKLECSHCHATFLKSEALELESTPTLVSYGGAKTYACPFCKSQYHFEREPAVSEAAGPSSLALSNSPAFKGMEQVQADAHQGSEPSEEPESTEISNAAEAVPPLEHTPPMNDEDPTLHIDPEPVAKVERTRKVDDAYFMQSNLKVYFECEVFKEDGECLKEAFMASVMDRSANAPEANQVVVFSNQKVYFCNIPSGELSIREVSPSQLSVKSVFPLNTLIFIEIGVYHQFALLEFRNSSQLLLFRDHERCKRVTDTLPVLVADIPNSSLQGVVMNETTTLCLLHEVILADHLPVEYYIAHHCYQAIKATNNRLKGARAFKEADLLQWLKDNSDFEDEEKLEELLQKFVQLHILDSAPGDATASGTQTVKIYSWNFSRFAATPMEHCALFMCCSSPDAPQAAVVCEGKLYLVRDNYQDWPLSKFTTMCLQRISHPQYEVIKQALITDVHSLNFSEKEKTVCANFFPEHAGYSGGSPSWTITFETEEAAALFVSLVRQRWRDAFHVDLQMNTSDIP